MRSFETSAGRHNRPAAGPHYQSDAFFFVSVFIDPCRGLKTVCHNNCWPTGFEIFDLHVLLAKPSLLIQEYLLLSDDDKQRGVLNSLDLVGSTAQLREDNRICIWLEDVWSER